MIDVIVTIAWLLAIGFPLMAGLHCLGVYFDVYKG
jgi:hypothetical protein